MKKEELEKIKKALFIIWASQVREATTKELKWLKDYLKLDPPSMSDRE